MRAHLEVLSTVSTIRSVHSGYLQNADMLGVQGLVQHHHEKLTHMMSYCSCNVIEHYKRKYLFPQQNVQMLLDSD